MSIREEQFKEELLKLMREFDISSVDYKMRKRSVQNTPKKKHSESQQNQGVKSSDLDVQKGNVS